MKAVKTIFFLSIMLSGLTTSAASGYQPSEGNQDEKKASVNVYYFHTNARCVTCRTIEAEAKQDIKELFGEKVNFISYNLDEKAGEAKGKELGVNSQVLIIVKDNRKIDITNQGFMYARSNPDKFKQVIEEKIKPLL
jgi:hypothetical protein